MPKLPERILEPFNQLNFSFETLMTVTEYALIELSKKYTESPKNGNLS